jgi:hypothetical protein
MTSIEKYYWYKEHEKEIEAFFTECFEEWFKEYIDKLPDIGEINKKPKIDFDNFNIIFNGCAFWVNDHEGESLLLDYDTVKQLYDLLIEVKQIIDK